MDLQGFDAYLKAKADTHVGYPYNLRYDYSELAPFFRYSINNLGDPYVESNYLLHSRAYEKDTVAFFAELYGAGDYWGYVTTSGTEGNLYGVLLGREQYPEGVLYSSSDTHYSIAKAAHFFKIPHVVDSLPHGEIDYKDLQRKLDPGRPAIVTVNLGTTLRGAMDDLDRVINVLDRAGVRDHFIHCDGALGGMLVPYLRSREKIT